MAFTRAHFIRHRPYLYHFTDAANRYHLRRESEMRSAAAWVAAANAHAPQVARPEEFLGTARTAPVTLTIGTSHTVTLNDQRPLRGPELFYALRGAYEDYIRLLNGFVFFWPGNEAGPTPKGRLAETFAARYRAFGCLRVPTADAWTDGAAVRFCCCNSGAPQRRDRLTRGPHIFVTHDDAALRVRRVAEVVFRNRLSLPASASWRDPGGADWQLLAAAD